MYRFVLPLVFFNFVVASSEQRREIDVKYSNCYIPIIREEDKKEEDKNFCDKDAEENERLANMAENQSLCGGKWRDDFADYIGSSAKINKKIKMDGLTIAACLHSLGAGESLRNLIVLMEPTPKKIQKNKKIKFPKVLTPKKACNKVFKIVVKKIK